MIIDVASIDATRIFVRMDNILLFLSSRGEESTRTPHKLCARGSHQGCASDSMQLNSSHFAGLLSDPPLISLAEYRTWSLQQPALTPDGLAKLQDLPLHFVSKAVRRGDDRKYGVDALDSLVRTLKLSKLFCWLERPYIKPRAREACST